LFEVNMTELEELWLRQSDEQLLEAFASLDEYSPASQDAIRAEFVRRGLAQPSQKSITFHEAEAVARLHRRLVGFVAAQWLSLICLIFMMPLLPRDVGAVAALLCISLFLVAMIALPLTGYQLLTRLEVERPGGIAFFMYMPLVSLLTLIGLRSLTQRWGKTYRIDVDFFGPTKASLARLCDAEDRVFSSNTASL
jgi:hypothetical protein